MCSRHVESLLAAASTSQHLQFLGSVHDSNGVQELASRCVWAWNVGAKGAGGGGGRGSARSSWAQRCLNAIPLHTTTARLDPNFIGVFVAYLSPKLSPCPTPTCSPFGSHVLEKVLIALDKGFDGLTEEESAQAGKVGDHPARMRVTRLGGRGRRPGGRGGITCLRRRREEAGERYPTS